MSRLLITTAAGLALLAATGQQAAYADTAPTTYVVSRDPGVLPEGIAVTADGTMYVTSFGTGAVYRGDTGRRTLRPFLPAGADGRTRAAGVHVDDRGRIFVAGYDTGALFVYRPDGSLVAKRIAPDPSAALNDLVITDDAAYVTDSVTDVVWRVQLDGEQIGELTPWVTPADFPQAPGYLNGIVADPDGRIALVADQGTGETGSERLYRLDLGSRTATVVTVTGGQMGADGLLLEGDRLYGVVNFPDGNGSWNFAVNVAVLDPDRTAATVVRQSQPAPLEQSPTTLARDGHRLLWVNSQLNSPSPTAPFTVSEVPGLR